MPCVYVLFMYYFVRRGGRTFPSSRQSQSKKFESPHASSFASLNVRFGAQNSMESYISSFDFLLKSMLSGRTLLTNIELGVYI